MRHKSEFLYQSGRELRVQTSADGNRVLTGYGIVYNSPSCDLGGFTEIVAPGAVTDSLRQNPNLLFLRDHDNSILLGRAPKTLTVTEDAIGLRFACTLPNTSQAADVAVLVERGDLPGCSFSFRNITDAWEKKPNGQLVRTLKKISVSELSVVSVPAYSATDVSLRSCPPEYRSLLTRSLDDDDEDECDCDCPECLAGDCADCSNPDCDDEDCEHGEESARSVELWQLETRIALARLR
jgi:HK97 family phage prohead protease